MNIGLIVHSVTGNTLSVAKKLQESLVDAGHTVELKEIKTEGKVSPGEKSVKFAELPSLDGYDALVFGSHTEAFQLEQAMKLYFNQIDNLTGQKVAFISTHQFPFSWMGGNAAINKMKSLCEAKGAHVLGGVVVDWSPEKKRQIKIETAVKTIRKLF